MGGNRTYSFRGIFEQYIDNQGKGRQVYQWIYKQQNRVIAWKYRGPKLFKRVLQWDPDIVVMPEYDCFNNKAEFLYGGYRLYFSEAMKQRGYDYQLIPIQRDG